MMGEGEEGMEGRKDERSEGGKGEGGKGEERKDLLGTGHGITLGATYRAAMSIQGGRCGEGGVRAMTDWNRLWKSRGRSRSRNPCYVLGFSIF